MDITNIMNKCYYPVCLQSPHKRKLVDKESISYILNFNGIVDIVKLDNWNVTFVFNKDDLETNVKEGNQFKFYKVLKYGIKNKMVLKIRWY